MQEGARAMHVDTEAQHSGKIWEPKRTRGPSECNLVMRAARFQGIAATGKVNVDAVTERAGHGQPELPEWNGRTRRLERHEELVRFIQRK